MDNLAKPSLAFRALFTYGSQADLVTLIKLVDPADVELYMTFQNNVTPETRELISRLVSWDVDGRKPDQRYADCALTLPKGKSLPLDDPMGILPPGIRNFVEDLDILKVRSEQEKVIPFLNICNKEGRRIEGEVLKIDFPCIDNRARTLEPYIVSDINSLIKRELYDPRMAQLGGIGGLARGFRPLRVSYQEIRRDEAMVRDCLRVLDSVPDQSEIHSFRIGSQPYDAGNREYYDWRCKTSMANHVGTNRLAMSFDECTDVRKIESDLRQRGINITLVEER